MKARSGLARATGRICRALILTTVLAGPQAVYAADACDDLLKAIPTLSGGKPLVASASGQSYKQMYDECDTKNTFAGRLLPLHGGRRLKCSSDPNHVRELVQYPNGTISFTAKAAVDADGSKLACGTGWPNQCGTWLSFDHGSERHDVNAEDTPFVVVPGAMKETGISFQKDTKIKAGDIAIVAANGKCSFGVVGDSGPYFRLGELSLRAHEDLGNPQCVTSGQYPCKALKGGGSGRGISDDVHYYIFPGTRPDQLFSQNVNAKSKEKGEPLIADFVEKYKR